MISSVVLVDAAAKSRMRLASTDMWLNPPCTPGKETVWESTSGLPSWPWTAGRMQRNIVRKNKELRFIETSQSTSEREPRLQFKSSIRRILRKVRPRLDRRPGSLVRHAE